MLTTFFYPYFLLIYGASWNVQQSLEGMGIRSSSFVEYDGGGHVMSSYWSPGQALLPIMGLLVVLTLALSMSIVLAGYILRRKTGAALAILLLCLPGVLNLLSLWPVMPLIPDTFVISGNGVLGSGWGISPLLGLGVLAGWSGLILLSDLLRLGENFGHVYDHFWCVSGVVAAIFFVADSQVGEHSRDLQDSVSTVQQASAYLSRQAITYDQWCSANQQQNSASCRWAANVQQKLLDYSTQGAKLYREFGPRSASDVYSVYGRRVEPTEVAAIRTEIMSYNAIICPIKQLGPGVWQLTQSARCLMTPAEYCFAFPEPLRGKIKSDQIGETAALSSECIVPALVALRERQEKLLNKVSEDLNAKHYRWIYYLLFSLVVGGKIAISTVKLLAMHLRTETESRRSLYLLKQFRSLALLLSRYCFSAVRRYMVWGRGQMRKARIYFRLIRRQHQRKIDH
ncbi:hypothetical protein [Duganella radicis]|uniref:Uncharacterized protein n=1 Tax=Duganella radicis TaxID=551988 RepID=A0A6L6PN83_9BURK|nr:hypothetical protein [Duganella radicis]MTV40423.1 hypothetical protein [Duganella radicis]